MLLLAGVSLSSAQVAVPEVREEFFAALEILQPVSLEEASARFENTPNPFFGPPPPEDPVQEDPEVSPVVSLPPRPEVTIDDLTARLRPSGIVEIQGIKFLIFGENRYREGESFVVRYQENTYTLQVVRLETGRYVLSWNDQTVTRNLQN